jgi:hypothetical protein
MVTTGRWCSSPTSSGLGGFVACGGEVERAGEWWRVVWSEVLGIGGLFIAGWGAGVVATANG